MWRDDATLLDILRAARLVWRQAEAARQTRGRRVSRHGIAAVTRRAQSWRASIVCPSCGPRVTRPPAESREDDGLRQPERRAKRHRHEGPRFESAPQEDVHAEGREDEPREGGDPPREPCSPAPLDQGA